jgi:hypothetical protein
MNDSENEAAEAELTKAIEAFLNDGMTEGFTGEELAKLLNRIITEARSSVVEDRRKAFKIVNKP